MIGDVVVKLQEPGYPAVVMPARDEAHAERLVLWYRRDAMRRSVPLHWEYTTGPKRPGL